MSRGKRSYGKRRSNNKKKNNQKNKLYAIKGNNKEARTALITGASAGLGVSFARVFAKNGFNVVLTARRKERLADLANEIESEYGVSAYIIAADLSNPAAPQEIYDECQRLKIDIDVLVNNAGVAVTGFFQETDWKRQGDSLQLMINSPSQLSYLFELGMVKRGYGRIINVSSFVGLITPTGAYTLYSAAKSFLIKFSQAHAAELKGTGVKVLALCPGFFKSEFHEDIVDETDIIANLPKRMFLNVDKVAEEGYDAVMNSDEVVYVNGRIYRLMLELEKGPLAHLRGRGKGKMLSYADRLRSKLNDDGQRAQGGV